MLTIFQFLTLGAYPWAKVHQKGRRPTIHIDLPPYKFSASWRKRSTRYAIPIFFYFLAWGTNVFAKVHQKGEDLVAYQVYHRANFHRLKSTNVRDIRYHVTKVLRTKKQANNKYASYPDGRISPHADRRHRK